MNTTKLAFLTLILASTSFAGTSPSQCNDLGTKLMISKRICAKEQLLIEVYASDRERISEELINQISQDRSQCVDAFVANCELVRSELNN